MKTFKFLLLTLLLMCGLIAHAQKVVVYKTDGTKVEYNASEVKDVKYKKAEPVYYWYAGWIVPSAENISTIINETAQTSKTDLTTHTLGGSTTRTSFTQDNPLASIDDNRYNPDAKATAYIVLPDGVGIYSISLPKTALIGTVVVLDESITIPNHKVYKTANTTRNIQGYLFY